jgi:hypothetical protein
MPPFSDENGGIFCIQKAGATGNYLPDFGGAAIGTSSIKGAVRRDLAPA